jgi:hypothetical protein
MRYGFRGAEAGGADQPWSADLPQSALSLIFPKTCRISLAKNLSTCSVYGNRSEQIRPDKHLFGPSIWP